MQFNYFNMEEAKHIDTSGYQPIAVITSFQKNGKFIPLKAQIEIENEQIMIDIVQVGKSEESSEMIYFDCMYRHEDSLKPIRLYYLIKQHQWVLKQQLRRC